MKPTTLNLSIIVLLALFAIPAHSTWAILQLYYDSECTSFEKQSSYTYANNFVALEVGGGCQAWNSYYGVDVQNSGSGVSLEFHWDNACGGSIETVDVPDDTTCASYNYEGYYVKFIEKGLTTPVNDDVPFMIVEYEDDSCANTKGKTAGIYPYQLDECVNDEYSLTHYAIYNSDEDIVQIKYYQDIGMCFEGQPESYLGTYNTDASCGTTLDVDGNTVYYKMFKDDGDIGDEEEEEEEDVYVPIDIEEDVYVPPKYGLFKMYTDSSCKDGIIYQTSAPSNAIILQEGVCYPLSNEEEDEKAVVAFIDEEDEDKILFGYFSDVQCDVLVYAKEFTEDEQCDGDNSAYFKLVGKFDDTPARSEYPLVYSLYTGPECVSSTGESYVFPRKMMTGCQEFNSGVVFSISNYRVIMVLNLHESMTSCEQGTEPYASLNFQVSDVCNFGVDQYFAGFYYHGYAHSSIQDLEGLTIPTLDNVGDLDGDADDLFEEDGEEGGESSAGMMKFSVLTFLVVLMMTYIL